ncbi:MAG: hypothetical protein ACPG7F_05100, partial [Aggregatilineales bacterium]
LFRNQKTASFKFEMPNNRGFAEGKIHIHKSASMRSTSSGSQGERIKTYIVSARGKEGTTDFYFGPATLQADKSTTLTTGVRVAHSTRSSPAKR